MVEIENRWAELSKPGYAINREYTAA